MGSVQSISSRTAVVCPHCDARYDPPAWLSLDLLDRVEVIDVGWIELRRCEWCEHAVASPAEEGPNDELFPTDVAARYCGLSVSGLRQAARRGDVRPWTSSGLKLLWRRSDLDRFLGTRQRRPMGFA
ncbi:MAG TPA: hypothetical protein VF765_35025 [Polyangiaceae bacterium]